MTLRNPCGCGPRTEVAGKSGLDLPWLCRFARAIGKRRGPGSPCVYLPERIISRPDPCIYDQFYLMNLNLPVTWDNPDVILRRGGVEQYTYDLTVSTQYDVEVVVHNASRRKAALGTEVRLRWIEFGAGATIRHPIGSTNVDVPVWPATSSVTFQWTTPATPGHYCLEVDLIHANDGNPSNNRGWNNTQVHEAHSQVRSPIRVFNQWPDGCPSIPEGGTDVIETPLVAGFMFFGASTGALGKMYDVVAHEGGGHQAHIHANLVGEWALWGLAAGLVLGVVRNLIGAWWRRRRDRDPERVAAIGRHGEERLPCDLVEMMVDGYRFNDKTGKDADPPTMFAPRAAAWPARVEPASFRFDPGEAFRDVTLVVDAPDGPGPGETFNVSVRQGGAPTGGVTVTVQREA